MIKYSIFYNDRLMSQSCTIYEQEKYPIKTGLLDRNGNNIYKHYTNIPTGYVHLKEGDA